MKSTISKGKSVDEAIYNGLKELGLSIDEVSIQILEQGSKGLFGLGKSALVSLTERSLDVSDEEEDDEAGTPAPKPSVPRPERQQQRPQSRPPQRSGNPNNRRPQRNTSSGGGGRREREETKFDPEQHEQKLQRLGYEFISTPATDFLSGVLTSMKLDCRLAVKQNDDNVKIDILGKNLGILIGRRGETLDSLQYLTSLVINKDKESYKRVTLDTEDYRRKREITLVKLARRLSSNVKKTGQKIVLEPMNPYERRILHSTLQNDEIIYTYSEGEEPNRYVVIDLKRNG